ncbi:hypothetical protein AKJ16_DCAP17606 [Drosera capensis]
MPPAIAAAAALLRRKLPLSSTHHLRRHLNTPPSQIRTPLSHPIYTIWGSNTGVGKTLVSAGLASSLLTTSSPLPCKFLYLKPVQTGFPSDSDSRFVHRKVSDLFLLRKTPGTLVTSNQTLMASGSAAEACGVKNGVGMVELGGYNERRGENDGDGEERVRRELVCRTLYAWREAVSAHLAAERENGVVEDEVLVELVQKCLWMGMDEKKGKGEVWSVIETAGGVASPGPSGTLQCDLYRPFRFPAVLVGDGRLGGISGTVSAYESLKLRGYDVAAVVLEDHGLVNEGSLSSYLQNSTPVLVLPPVPKNLSDDLMLWFEESKEVFVSLKGILAASFLQRVQRLHDMPKKALDVFWWPFTQHQLVTEGTVTVIDSRCGENFSVHKVMAENTDLISQEFDGCASWWTQGPDSKLQIELARDVGYAAARYGHVMFPENVYEPALQCWASRSFFSDNGSTAIEIALKMAFRKFSTDHGLIDDFLPNDKASPKDLRVLALKGSYHGDTLGAMEAQAPSVYTGFLQQPWYTGRGLFIDPPTACMQNGVWNIYFLEGLYSKEHGQGDLIIHGAGGMHMVDPLFQRALVIECQSRKIPVIFDQVFTGFWRLGVESAADLLHCSPDIGCFAKLMTGGVLPLSATLASDAVFDAFMGDSKAKALLHGHSYSAHAMGCAAACKAIKWFKNPKTNTNLSSEGKLLRVLWDMEIVREISSHPAVKRLVVMGTLFAFELQTGGSTAGYTSTYASSLLKSLREDGVYMRPLGNVLYLMCGPCTSPQVCSQLLVKVQRRIEEFFQKNTRDALNQQEEASC